MKAREEGRRRDALFDQNCLHDLEHWVRTDRRRALRILKLIEVVLRDPLEDRVNRNRSADSLPAPGPGVSTRNTVWSIESKQRAYDSSRPGTTTDRS